MNKKGVRGNDLEQARRECMDRERWRSFCLGLPLGGRSQRKRGVRAIDGWLIEGRLKDIIGSKMCKTK